MTAGGLQAGSAPGVGVRVGDDLVFLGETRAAQPILEPARRRKAHDAPRRPPAKPGLGGLRQGSQRAVDAAPGSIAARFKSAQISRPGPAGDAEMQAEEAAGLPAESIVLSPLCSSSIWSSSDALPCRRQVRASRATAAPRSPGSASRTTACSSRANGQNDMCAVCHNAVSAQVSDDTSRPALSATGRLLYAVRTVCPSITHTRGRQALDEVTVVDHRQQRPFKRAMACSKRSRDGISR